MLYNLQQALHKKLSNYEDHMGFRTVLIKNRSKLDLRMNYLVCRNDTETKVFIPEISNLILESTAISLTTALLSELSKNNVKIIICDEKHNPESELVSYYGHYNCVKNITKQINWDNTIKGKIWQEIIKNKILQQSKLLAEYKFIKESKMLDKYFNEVEFNDKTNREGHSAKVYFNAIFGNEFARRDNTHINRALNYGYAILLSCFNRELVKLGYLTQLGIWHCNEFNYFNLSSDFMEPFRPLVDRIALKLQTNENDYKMQMLEIFNCQLKINGKKQFLENAISVYCRNLLDALNDKNEAKIKFYEI